MKEKEALRLCRKILKLQERLFKGIKGENYMDIYARNGEDGMPCVGITLKMDKGFKRISMVDGKLLTNDIWEE